MPRFASASSLVLLSLLCSAPRVYGEPPVAVDRASCVVTVRGNGPDGSGRGLDIQTVNATLTSTSFIDPAVAEALNLDAATWPEVVSIELSPAGRNGS